jgi:asparagine synthase (glutamine-hydrolysing)
VCGITGWVDLERDLTGERATLEAMTATMERRGPDAGGVWISCHAGLGHRRLAVLDVANGHQPMVIDDVGEHPVVVVHSGEVYNFADLRTTLEKHGQRFRTGSDTEVVLRAYLQWGEAFVDRLVGMYALAVWDARTEVLLLVRDRFGIKPLYYHRLPSGVLFGSEPKAVLAHPLVEPVVDGDGLRELFATVKTPGEAVFKGMREVRPAHLVRVGRDGLVERRYWAMAGYRHGDDRRTTVRRTRQLLERSVGEHLVADVPIGALLSGGLDSSAVTALAQRALDRRNAGPLRSYAVEFSGGERDFRADAFRPALDAPFVEEVVDRLGCAHRTIVIDSRRLADPAVRAATLQARDLPPMGDLDTSLYLLCAAVRQGATVVLSGEGADELFGGYAWYGGEEALRADTFPWLTAARRLGRYSMFEPAFAQLDMAAYHADRYAEARAEVPRLAGENGHERRMREVTYLHLTRFLPSPLDRNDRMSMAVGLEVRVPYCDHRLVEYVFNVPWALKSLDGRPKGLLRAAARHLLPPSVVARPKTPYPTAQDPAYHATLRDAVQGLLTDGGAPVLQLVRRPTVRALAAMPPSGSEVVRMGLERIVALNDWLERYRVRLAP